MAGASLQDLVLHRLAELQRERGGRALPLRQVAARSFGRVSEELLHAIVSGHPAVTLTEREIKGLAVALGLEKQQVRAAANSSP